MIEFANRISLVIIGVTLAFFVVGIFGNRKTLLWIYGIMMVINDAQFRIRAVSEMSIDYQVLMKIFVWVCVFILSFFYIMKSRLMFKRFVSLFMVKNKVFSFFVILALVSAAYSPNPGLSLAGSLMMVGGVLLTFVITSLFDIEKIFRMLVISLMVGILLSWLYYFIYPDAGRWYEYGLIRLSGIYSPTHLAMIAVCLFFIAKYTLVNRRFVRLWIIVISLTTAIFTLSRAPLIALLLAYFLTSIYLFFKERKTVYSNLLGIVFMLIMVILVVYMYGIHGVPEYTTTILSRSGTFEDVVTLTGRVYVWQWIIDKIVSSGIANALFGFGWGSFRFLFSEESLLQLTTAHNFLLEILFSLGCVGLIAFFALIVHILKKSLGVPVYMSMTMSILVYSMTSSIISLTPNILFYMLIIPMFLVDSFNSKIRTGK